MTSKTLYLTLTLCAATSFVLILLIYAFVFDRDPLNRIGYGVFVSVVPALFTLLAPKFARSSPMRIAGTYFLLFGAVIVLQGLLR